MRKLGQLKGVGPLVGVVAFSGLAQFVLYTVWVLYNSFKFGWGPRENGWSLAVVGIVAVLVQGVLLGRLLKRFSPQKLAIWGLVSSVMGYTLWGAATEGWMMYAVIAVNLLGGTVTASVQSMISSAADSKSQGQTMGAVSSLNGLMAVVAPVLGAPMLAIVSHYPPGDLRNGGVVLSQNQLGSVSQALEGASHVKTPCSQSTVFCCQAGLSVGPVGRFDRLCAPPASGVWVQQPLSVVLATLSGFRATAACVFAAAACGCATESPQSVHTRACWGASQTRGGLELEYDPKGTVGAQI